MAASVCRCSAVRRRHGIGERPTGQASSFRHDTVYNCAMTSRFHHLLLMLFLVGAGFSASADPTRVAVIYATADELAPSSFADMVAGMEKMPAVEVLRLALDGGSDQAVAQLRMAAKSSELPLKLAAAGGNIGPIVVLYPDIGEPYRGVFHKIIEGIEEKSKSKVAGYPVGRNFNPHELSAELKRQDIRVVIALGRHGLNAASLLDKDVGIVAGGVLFAPDADTRGGAVLSLAPDPALLFARLKSVSPKTRRVFVVYEPQQNGWLIKLARDAARSQGIELVAQEAPDLKTALGYYQSFLASAEASRDALWLPQDSATVDESTVLPFVLQESWSKAIPLFSSNVSHVRRGALFALYPNNLELGRNLAASALGVVAGAPPSRGILPLSDVLTAFNTRTASHLGLSLDAARRQGIDLLFPEQ